MTTTKKEHNMESNTTVSKLWHTLRKNWLEGAELMGQAHAEIYRR